MTHSSEERRLDKKLLRSNRKIFIRRNFKTELKSAENPDMQYHKTSDGTTMIATRNEVFKWYRTTSTNNKVESFINFKIDIKNYWYPGSWMDVGINIYDSSDIHILAVELGDIAPTCEKWRSWTFQRDVDPKYFDIGEWQEFYGGSDAVWRKCP